MPIGLIVFTVIVLIVIGVFIVIMARGILQWIRNNNSPSTSVQARAVTKRMFAQGGSATSYYIRQAPPAA